MTRPEANPDQDHRAIRTLASVAIFVAAHVALGPAASADHIVSMDVSQVDNTGLSVTLQVDLTIDGDCCGGVFAWQTGDGGSGVVDDGVDNGAYVGDAAGAGLLTDTDPLYEGSRSFEWERTGPNPITILVAYDYLDFGTYTVSWDDCCPQAVSSITVTVDDLDETPACSDGSNNDEDGGTDWPLDAGCESPDDNSESPSPECFDGVDNDGDGKADFRNDLQCLTPYDKSEGDGGEIPECTLPDPPQPPGVAGPQDEGGKKEDKFDLTKGQTSAKISIPSGCATLFVKNAGESYAVRVVFYNATGGALKVGSSTKKFKDFPFKPTVKVRFGNVLIPRSSNNDAASKRDFDAVSFTLENRDNENEAEGIWKLKP